MTQVETVGDILDGLGLSPAQHAARDGKITASFAPYLMAGNEERILNEWRRLVGDPGYVAPDFSDNWPVKFGQYIEPFALDWHQRKLGHALTERGASVVDPERPYVSCTLDAFDAPRSMVIDVKALGGHRKLDEAVTFYLPQLVVQRGCKSAARAALLVVHGGGEPVEIEAEIPVDYEAEVWRRIDQFWACCETLAQPIAMAPIAAPVPAIKEYDFTGNNAWGEHAATWLEHRTAAKKFEGAVKGIKELIPADAKRAIGFGITAERNKAGSISIKEQK